jgi:putative membrane protein
VQHQYFYYITREKKMSDLKDPRVLFAAERTLLAWNRTSLALIAFGFAIERTGILVQIFAPKKTSANMSLATLWLGLGFIALGAVSALYASRQHLAVLKTLTPAEFPANYDTRWGVVMNIIVAILGATLGVALYVGS